MSLRGCIRRPPLLMNGQLYVLDTAGKLFEIAPRAEAQPREVARLKSGEAGFNSGAIVEAAASAKGLRGHLYLAVSSSRLEAVSLDTGNTTVLYEPREGESILANSSEADSTAFKGVTAAPGCAAIAVRTAAREVALTLVYFSGERPVEQPLKMTGTDACGPWLSDRFITLCTEESVGVYDLERERVFIAALPDEFLPMMCRERKGIGIAPGCMPFSTFVGESGIEVWIAGYQADRARGRDAVRAGLLQISVEHNAYSFLEVSGGEDFCFQSLPEGKFFISTFAGIQFPGQSNESTIRETMKQGMPVSLESGTVAYFRNDPDPGWHQIAIDSDNSAATAFFPDANNECDEDSCCGILIDGPDVVVPFLRISSDPSSEGLKFAHWRFA